MRIDINCDMGEGIGNDEAIMPFISSSNIACGYHAGDVDTMKKTIDLAIQYKVAIGAHPSFLDRMNFGRTEMDIEPAELFDLVSQQLFLLNEIASDSGTSIHHVKPHGALYNMSARNKEMAAIIISAIKESGMSLKLYGLSGSYLVSEAKKAGLQTLCEVFADRTYQDDGTLTPRSQAGSLLEDSDKVVQQVLQMINESMVTSINGNMVPIVAETICIHGDGKYAVTFAKAIHSAIHQQ